MKLKQFIEENEVSGFEIVPDTLILNVMVDGVSFGLDVDVSNTKSGTKLKTVTEFDITGDTLTVDGLTLNIDETELLSIREKWDAISE